MMSMISINLFGKNRTKKSDFSVNYFLVAGQKVHRNNYLSRKAVFFYENKFCRKTIFQKNYKVVDSPPFPIQNCFRGPLPLYKIRYKVIIFILGSQKLFDVVSKELKGSKLKHFFHTLQEKWNWINNQYEPAWIGKNPLLESRKWKVSLKVSYISTQCELKMKNCVK